MISRKVLVCGVMVGIFSALSVSAQKQDANNAATPATAAPAENKYLDFNYTKLAVRERKAIAFPSLREADAVYAKRIQRIVDVREKKNLPMKWPKNPLYKVLYDNITKGEAKGYGKLKAYTVDSIASAYTVEGIKNRGGHSVTVSIQPDPINNPDYTKDTDMVESFDWSKITRYIISEEWIFDKQRSTFFPRIIAFAPLFKQTVNGVELAEQQLCWINYNEFRKIAINEEVFNRSNDAMRLTYNDFFEDRLFSSYVTKESNEFDAAIKDLPEFKDDPMGSLYESERIKDNLFNWEHDLWEY